jgi:hypothetical protein
MVITISPLRGQGDLLADRLKEDGWEVKPTDKVYVCTHPKAPTQPLARKRLAELGLLTCRHLRIFFN